MVKYLHLVQQFFICVLFVLMYKMYYFQYLFFSLKHSVAGKNIMPTEMFSAKELEKDICCSGVRSVFVLREYRTLSPTKCGKFKI